MFFTNVAAILIALLSLAIILIVLLQKPKGEGASSLASNSSMKELLSVAQMPSFFERVTYWLVSALFVLVLVMTSLLASNYQA